MELLTKEQIQDLLRIEPKGSLWFGEFDLFVKGFGKSILVSIALPTNSRNLEDRTIQTINEVANLTRDQCKHIFRLLFDDAMIIKEDCGWGDPSPPPEIPPANWLRRLFWRWSKHGIVELAPDDPRHPLFGINTPDDLEARIKWENICIDDSQETPKRIAFLTCYPAWDVEHGREIAICDGVPVGVNGIELNEFFYLD